MMKYVHRLLGQLGVVVQRYPIMVATSLAAATLFVSHQKVDRLEAAGSRPTLWYLSITLILGLSILFGMRMWAQRHGKGHWPGLVGLGALALFYYLFFPHGELGLIHSVSLPLIFMITHLLASLLPCVGGGWQYFWDYNMRLFTSALTAVLFSVITFGGAGLILLAVDELLVELPRRFIEHTLTFLSIFGTTMIFLLLNRDGWQDLNTPLTYPKPLKFLITYIVTPLLGIFGVILYLYLIKILINGELPDEMVCGFVMAYSLIGLLTWLLARPLFDDEKNNHVDIFGKGFFISVLPLMAAYFIGLMDFITWERFHEYHITSMAAGVLLIGLSIAYTIRPRGPVQWVPASLLIAILLLLITPYLNMFGVVTRHHEKRVAQILASEQLLDEKGKLDFTKPLQRSQIHALGDGIHEILARRPDRPLPFLTDSLRTAYIEAERSYQMKDRFLSHFTNIVPEPGQTDPTSYDLKSAYSIRTVHKQPKIITLNDADFLIPELHPPYKWPVDDFHLTLQKEVNFSDRAYQKIPTYQLLKENEVIDQVFLIEDLQAQLDSIILKHPASHGSIHIEQPIQLTSTIGPYDVELQLDYVFYHPDEILRMNRGRLLIRKLINEAN